MIDMTAPGDRMVYNEDVLELAEGTRLHTWRCETQEARAQVVVVHGFGEHSGRYRELAEFLVQRGFAIASFDLRGHGKSSGLAGHVRRFTDYERDLSRVIELTIGRGPRKRFLIGHSMGGLITLRYLSRQPLGVAGAIVSAPLLGFAVRIPTAKRALGAVSGFIAPRLRMANEVDPAVLSRDPEVGRAYERDPLVHRLVSTRWFREATRLMNQMPEAARSISSAVLVLHGSHDKLASVDATRIVFDRIASADKELIVYPGYYHELFNEPDRRQVFDTVAEWLSRHLEK
jgi:alpha-beta hydrolase superfamily lysophospholipase